MVEKVTSSGGMSSCSMRLHSSRQRCVLPCSAYAFMMPLKVCLVQGTCLHTTESLIDGLHL